MSITTILMSIVTILASIEQVNTPLEMLLKCKKDINWPTLNPCIRGRLPKIGHGFGPGAPGFFKFSDLMKKITP